MSGTFQGRIAFIKFSYTRTVKQTEFDPEEGKPVVVAFVPGTVEILSQSGDFSGASILSPGLGAGNDRILLSLANPVDFEEGFYFANYASDLSQTGSTLLTFSDIVDSSLTVNQSAAALTQPIEDPLPEQTPITVNVAILVKPIQ